MTDQVCQRSQNSALLSVEIWQECLGSCNSERPRNAKQNKRYFVFVWTWTRAWQQQPRISRAWCQLLVRGEGRLIAQFAGDHLWWWQCLRSPGAGPRLQQKLDQLQCQPVITGHITLLIYCGQGSAFVMPKYLYPLPSFKSKQHEMHWYIFLEVGEDDWIEK